MVRKMRSYVWKNCEEIVSKVFDDVFYSFELRALKEQIFLKGLKQKILKFVMNMWIMSGRLEDQNELQHKN